MSSLLYHEAAEREPGTLIRFQGGRDDRRIEGRRKVGLGPGSYPAARFALEALAVAFALTVMLLMVLGLLQLAVGLSMDDWSYRHLWPIVACFYGGAYVLARRRYE